MMLLLRWLILVVMLLLAGGPQSANGKAWSARVLRLISVLSGKSNNDQQRATGQVNIDRLTDTFRPAEVPAFPKFAHIYFEQDINDNIARMHVLQFYEKENSAAVHVRPLNFTDPSQHKPGEFDPEDLKDLEASDFDMPPRDCEITFVEITTHFFVTVWPDCTVKDSDGKRPAYIGGYQCGIHFFIVQSGLHRERAEDMVFLQRAYENYPLLPYLTEGVEDFKNPCEE